MSVTDAGISRPVTSARSACGARIVGVADDDDLDRCAHVALERTEEIREPGRVARHRSREHLEDRDGRRLRNVLFAE